MKTQPAVSAPQPSGIYQTQGKRAQIAIALILIGMIAVGGSIAAHGALQFGQRGLEPLYFVGKVIEAHKTYFALGLFVATVMGVTYTLCGHHSQKTQPTKTALQGPSSSGNSGSGASSSSSELPPPASSTTSSVVASPSTEPSATALASPAPTSLPSESLGTGGLSSSALPLPASSIKPSRISGSPSTNLGAGAASASASSIPPSKIARTLGRSDMSAQLSVQEGLTAAAKKFFTNFATSTIKHGEFISGTEHFKRIHDTWSLENDQYKIKGDQLGVRLKDNEGHTKSVYLVMTFKHQNIKKKDKHTDTTVDRIHRKCDAMGLIKVD